MDLTQLSVMLARPGPYITVLIDVSRDAEDAGHQLELRLRAVRTNLLDDGATTGITDQIIERVSGPTGLGGQVGRFVVADRDGIAADELLSHWQGPAEVTYGPLPDVTTWLAHREATPPVLVVVADRIGADFHVYDAWPERPTVERAVDGEHLHVSKVPDGGWAMAALQGRTEEVWRRNAGDVAAEIARLSVPGLLVVLAGDERARHEIMNAWTPLPDQRVVHAEHGARAPGSAEDTLQAEVRDAVRAVVIDRQLARIRELEERVGRREAVALGVEPVIDAFGAGQVATVFVNPSRASAKSVRAGDHPGWVLSSVPGNAELRADLAVLAAAAATSADAVFAGSPPTPEDGVAAVLRWD